MLLLKPKFYRKIYPLVRRFSVMPNAAPNSNLSLNMTTIESKENVNLKPFQGRFQLKDAKRITVKLGHFSRSDGSGLSLSRLASIVEEVADCRHEGRQVILLSSNAAAFGRQKLSNEMFQLMANRASTAPIDPAYQNMANLLDSHAASAVGQSELMSLYDAMFSLYNVKIAQILLTRADLCNKATKDHLFGTLQNLLAMNVVPILNTNDAVDPLLIQDGVSTFEGPEECLDLKDIDCLSALLAAEIRSDLLILMSNVNGVYDKPPCEHGARIFNTFTSKKKKDTKMGKVTKTGNGSIGSKVDASLWAVDKGVSVVVCNEMENNLIKSIITGKRVGTFFAPDSDKPDLPVDFLAGEARIASKRLENLKAEERSEIINNIVSLLENRKDEILKANSDDVYVAQKNFIPKKLYQFLRISEDKWLHLLHSLKSLASTHLGKVCQSLRLTKLAENLCLQQVRVPLGVVLLPLESRPYKLVQAAALTIATGNGLIVSGGPEAKYTHRILLEVIRDALTPVQARSAVALASYNEEIDDILGMSDYFDMVIPHGSSEFLNKIKNSTKAIPVLGSDDGICHVYVDEFADHDKTLKLVRHSKCDCPTARNSMDTLLIHEKQLMNPLFNDICKMFKEEKVIMYAGKRLSNLLTFGTPPASSMLYDYHNLECTVEMVISAEEAISHIEKYGKSRSNVIITENANVARMFLESVDTACVFRNTSSRLSDSVCFGLGPEVTFSSEKTNIRGPVGIDGLLATKWILEGVDHTCTDLTKTHDVKFY